MLDIDVVALAQWAAARGNETVERRALRTILSCRAEYEDRLAFAQAALKAYDERLGSAVVCVLGRDEMDAEMSATGAVGDPQAPAP